MQPARGCLIFPQNHSTSDSEEKSLEKSPCHRQGTAAPASASQPTNHPSPVHSRMDSSHSQSLAEAGRDLLKYLAQPLCSGRITYSQLPGTIFRQLQGWRLHQLSGQCLVTIPAKTFSLIFRGNLFYSSLYSSPLFLPLDTTRRSLAPSPLHLPFLYIDEIPSQCSPG